MNIAKLEETLHTIVEDLNQESFIYELLLAYGKPKASITRLKEGTYNLAKNKKNEVLWKKNLYFKKFKDSEGLHNAIDELRREQALLKHSPRFIIVTDFKTILAVDTKTEETLDISLLELCKHFDFFLPWAGREKAQVQLENIADVKAAGRMAQLYDEICKDNPCAHEGERHALNVFLCRLLFCFFAEDTEIFKVLGCFTQAIRSHTEEDGSDLSQYLERLFEVLSLPNEDAKRKNYPAFLREFPYVNGGLFKDHFNAPKFYHKSRNLLLKSGDQDWSAINPDIFGSMMQGVVHTSHRASLGMHYTSVPNIMKVIEPLFLNELYEELEKAQDEPKKLQKLHERIQKIKVFDPACGSGNFLIIAYRELRRLEIQIFKAMQGISGQQKFSIPLSSITLTQFYGIEIDDFAHEIAMLSLWLAEHQMNVAFKEEFGKTNPSLPLKKGGNIVCNNATRIDWEKVCPREESSEIFVLGNPPYLGSVMQNIEQKADKEMVFKGIKAFKNLDYISCWFLKGSEFIKDTNAKLAFVSTNSITQGDQVALLWPHIFEKNLEIFFAHQSFKWQNNAKKNAGVTCVIIGLRKHSKTLKKLYLNGSNFSIDTENINAYLINSKNIIISRRPSPISWLPKMVRGNMPYDGGNLILSEEEKNHLVFEYPSSQKFIKKLIGSDELLKGYTRWCLWIEDNEINEAVQIIPIAERIEKVKAMRLASTDSSANQLAERPHQFREVLTTKSTSVIIPSVSSEKREYIPIGLIDSQTTINNLAYAIYDAEPFVFGIISSKMHMAWVRVVAGQLETRIRYTSSLCYNNFPFPTISDKQKETIASHVFNVLSEREKHPERTLAQLYDPDKTPDGLREAHHQLDLAVERCYRSKPFQTDEERLEYLFKLYEVMSKSKQTELQNA